MKTTPFACVVIAGALAAAACSKSPDEPAPINKDPSPGATSQAGGGSSVVAAAGDPLHGKWTLADATKDIPGTGALYADLETPKGTLQCKLFADKAPITVANFIGLARGTRPWKNSKGQWVSEPAYDGTTFHRIIKGFMIQGGDKNGAQSGMPGAGDPGYVIPDEVWTGATHDRPGLMCMANKGPNTNGSQFFITDGAPKHLDGGYTIFGECGPVQVIHDLASWPTQGDKAVNAPAISKVTITRR